MAKDSIGQLNTCAKVRLHQLEPFLASAAENGVNVEQVLASIGIHDGMRGVTSSAMIDLIDYFRLQRGIGRTLDDFTSHLSERRLKYKTGTFLVSTIQEAQTLQDAINSTCDHYNMLHGDDYNSAIVREGLLYLTINDAEFPYRFKDSEELKLLVGDCLAIKTHCTLDSLTHGQASRALHHVRLKRKRNIDDSPQNSFWDVPVRYGGTAYELVYDFEEACAKVPEVRNVDFSADGVLTRVIAYLEARTEHQSSSSIQSRVLELILGGHVSQTTVAIELGMSVATLRRRLSEEGCTFRNLVTDVTLDQADRMLRRGHSVVQVSAALNYSDMRAFIRAYKKGRGQTPAAYLKSLKLENVENA
ncbi:MAG: AraC family transcriptional regulator [Pseudomonadota bacterium]